MVSQCSEGGKVFLLCPILQGPTGDILGGRTHLPLLYPVSLFLSSSFLSCACVYGVHAYVYLCWGACECVPMYVCACACVSGVFFAFFTERGYLR